MRFACRITNDSNTLTIFIAFPRQQYLHKRALTLRYTYIAYLLFFLPFLLTAVRVLCSPLTDQVLHRAKSFVPLYSLLRSWLSCRRIQNLQGGSNMTGTNCDLFTHNQSRSYLNHLVHQILNRLRKITYRVLTWYFLFHTAMSCVSRKISSSRINHWAETTQKLICRQFCHVFIVMSFPHAVP
jgi:hypothetical protein